MVPDSVAPEAGEVMETVSEEGLVLFTVMDTAALVALLAEISVATAVSTWDPLARLVVSKEKLYGDDVVGAPILFPSTRNCTLAIPTLLLAFAERAMVPDTVA